MSTIVDRLEQLSRKKVSVIAAFSLVVIVAVLAIWSRSRHDPRGEEVVGEATITGGTYPGGGNAPSGLLVPHDIAIERLTYVVCAHEAACSAISPGDHAYPGDDECSHEQRLGLNVELDRAEACSAGIDTLALERCSSAIEAEACGRAAHAPRSLDLCRASVLCPRF